MQTDLLSSLSGLPDFVLHMGIAVALFAAFMAIYTRITAHPEILLIRQNNVAAATSYSGAMLGFVLPIGSAVKNSVSPVDLLIWALIAGLVQVLAYFATRLLYRNLSARICHGELAAGLHLAAVSLSVGVINAAAMTY